MEKDIDLYIPAIRLDSGLEELAHMEYVANYSDGKLGLQVSPQRRSEDGLCRGLMVTGFSTAARNVRARSVCVCVCVCDGDTLQQNAGPVIIDTPSLSNESPSRDVQNASREKRRETL